MFSLKSVVLFEGDAFTETMLSTRLQNHDTVQLASDRCQRCALPSPNRVNRLAFYSWRLLCSRIPMGWRYPQTRIQKILQILDFESWRSSGKSEPRGYDRRKKTYPKICSQNSFCLLFGSWAHINLISFTSTSTKPTTETSFCVTDERVASCYNAGWCTIVGWDVISHTEYGNGFDGDAFPTSVRSPTCSTHPFSSLVVSLLLLLSWSASISRHRKYSHNK